MHQDAERIVILAPWTGDKPLFLGYTIFEPGDQFFEIYYQQRWFSIWEVRSGRNGRTKGWYCNVCQPFELEGRELRFRDMELDVFVFTDGRFVVLDEDDLDRADIPEADKGAARAGLAEVTSWITQRRTPFDRIGPPRRIEPFWEEGPRYRD